MVSFEKTRERLGVVSVGALVRKSRKHGSERRSTRREEEEDAEGTWGEFWTPELGPIKDFSNCQTHLLNNHVVLSFFAKLYF